MTDKPKFLWPAYVYDKIKASCDAVGGVGSGTNYRVRGMGPLPATLADIEAGNVEPWCIVGHAMEVGVLPTKTNQWTSVSVFGVQALENDAAVDMLLADNEARTTRVPFDAWAEKVGVVRGA